VGKIAPVGVLKHPRPTLIAGAQHLLAKRKVGVIKNWHQASFAHFLGYLQSGKLGHKTAIIKA
jgi:hypothetical protein